MGILGIAGTENSLNVYSGTRFGNGYSSSATYGYNGANRVASSTTISRISNDWATGYNLDLDVIEQYMEDGDLANAMLQYDELLDDIKSSVSGYSCNLTESQIRSALADAYKFRAGTSMTKKIGEQVSSSFVQGLKEGVPLIGWLGASAYSKSEANAKLTGKKVRATDKVAEGAGAALSGAASGALIGSVVPGAGTAIGAVIGGLAGVGAVIIKDIGK